MSEDLRASCGCPIPPGFEEAEHLASCPFAVPAAAADAGRPERTDEDVALDTLRELARDEAASGEVRLAAAEALLRAGSEDWLVDVAEAVAEFERRIDALEEAGARVTRRGLRRLTQPAAHATR